MDSAKKSRVAYSKTNKLLHITSTITNRIAMAVLL
jgi:hypothetical protein